MSDDAARHGAEQNFKMETSGGSQPIPEYERRARDVRRKMQYLRQLRLTKQRDELSRRSQ